MKMGQPMTPMRQLVKWYRRERRCRTAKVREGTARIDWLDPGTRVSWSEIVAKAEEFGIKSDPVTLRLDFDRAQAWRDA